MCSEHSNPRPHRTVARRILGALALSVALLPLAACGRKEPPLPPLRHIPRATQDLQVLQQGRELVFQLSYPTETTTGLPLPELARVELWRLARPLPAATEAAEPPKPRTVETREFTAGAGLDLALAGRDLSESVYGDRLVFRTPLPEIVTGQAEAFYFKVRSVVSERDVSGDSNLVAIVPREPPPPPTELTVTPLEGGIEVGWSAPESTEPLGFNLYRRDPRSRSWGDPMAAVGAAELRFLDRSAVFGQSYIYGVTTVVGRSPLIESAPGGAREIEYRDRFAPPPPRGLVALAESGSIRLIWEPSEAEDTAGYQVYRRQGTEGFRRIHDEAVTGLELLDREVSPGTVYTYRLTAVDGEGNESEPGDEVSAEAR